MRSPMRFSSSCRPASVAQFMKQFVERGLDKSGIKLIATGDVTDDDILNGMGDAVLGDHHDAPLFGSPRQPGEQGVRRGVQEAANNGLRPNFMAVGGYDGMHLIYDGAQEDQWRGGARRSSMR